MTTPKPIKPKVEQLTDVLFDRLAVMRDPNLRGSQLQDELARTKAMTQTSDQIIKAWALQVEAGRLIADAKHQSVAVRSVGHLTGAATNDGQG